jgi:hypothetical protein
VSAFVPTFTSSYFLDRIYRIFILHFQFPEENENTQSPPANKIGKPKLVIKEADFSLRENTSQNY